MSIEPKLPLQILCFAALGLAVFSAEASVPSSPPKALQPLLVTLNERLNIGDLVALTKWDSGKPIQDSPREAQVIANAKQLATDRKMDPEDVGQLLAAQMEANKLVQYGLLAKWQAAGKAPDTPRPDLAKQIRPRLDELQNRLLQQYADFAPFRNDPSCANWIAKARASLATDPLHELALIRATGELCTAGLPR
ncbi:chorismate mutase [Pseudomonas frederiksbergensis]|uniref:Chorismate mutase n=1 Tax=Pseudomonas frederiksbergensis TaxID=104087 RepID=A0A423KHB5_9PSED|nr:chorismate mutase [Pseudomonas frederiksbergensis]RON52487.1 chorismate mutase [Pseudomonas frederiksbergensis]